MRKPNLLFLYTDEQSIHTLSAYGNTQIEMPNLNKLSDQSSVFQQAYVTQPVCTPSRSTLLTGLYPHNNGCIQNNIPLDQNIKCFPELLDDSEYKTGHFGKWHLGDELFRQHGFDKWISTEDGYQGFFREGLDRNTRSDYCKHLIQKGFIPENGKFFSRGESAKLPEIFSKPAFLAEHSKRFIEENKNATFALFVNFLEPHMPFFGPRDNQYDPEDIPLPENFGHELCETNPSKTKFFAHRYHQHGISGIDLSSEKGWKQLRANYWGLCSLVDKYVGEIIDKLKECALYDDTIIVFTSDHGDMMGSHRLVAKCVMFEEAVRVPFFIKLSGQIEGKRIKGPVSQIDIVPTLLDALGKDIPENLDGKSLKPLVESGGTVDESNDVFIEWLGTDGCGGSQTCIPESLRERIPDKNTLNKYLGDKVCTLISPSGWKYNWSPLGEDELYDLNTDPGEMHNLAFEPDQKYLIADMRKKITEWKAKVKYAQNV